MSSLGDKARNFFVHSRVREAFFFWAWRRFRGHEPLIDLPRGARVGATGRFNDFYGIWGQHPGEEEFVTYCQLLCNGGVFMDVGANMGLTSVLAWSTGLAHRIIAFEPTHTYAEVWHRNIARNDVRNAVLMQCAVGEVSGEIEFLVNPKAPLHNRLRLGVSEGRYGRVTGDQTRIEKVAVITLDEIAVALQLDRIALLKIDVEGAEPFVLRGATRLLERKAIDSMLIEFIPEFMSEMGVMPRNLIRFVHDFRYAFFAIQEDGTIGARLSEDGLLARDFRGLNVAIRPIA